MKLSSYYNPYKNITRIPCPVKEVHERHKVTPQYNTLDWIRTIRMPMNYITASLLPIKSTSYDVERVTTIFMN